MKHQKHNASKLSGRLFTLSILIFCLGLPAISSLWVESNVHAWADDQSQGLSIEAQQQSESCWSPTDPSRPCKPATLTKNSQTVLPPNQNQPCRVAIFYPDGNGFAFDLANVLNTDPQIQAVVISQADLESGGLNGFNTLIARLDAAGPFTSQSFQAIQSFVAGGGGYIGEWWGAGAALSG